MYRNYGQYSYENTRYTCKTPSHPPACPASSGSSFPSSTITSVFLVLIEYHTRFSGSPTTRIILL